MGNSQSRSNSSRNNRRTRHHTNTDDASNNSSSLPSSADNLQSNTTETTNHQLLSSENHTTIDNNTLNTTTVSSSEPTEDRFNASPSGRPTKRQRTGESQMDPTTTTTTTTTSQNSSSGSETIQQQQQQQHENPSNSGSALPANSILRPVDFQLQQQGANDQSNSHRPTNRDSLTLSHSMTTPSRPEYFLVGVRSPDIIDNSNQNGSNEAPSQQENRGSSQRDTTSTSASENASSGESSEQGNPPTSFPNRNWVVYLFSGSVVSRMQDLQNSISETGGRPDFDSLLNPERANLNNNSTESNQESAQDNSQGGQGRRSPSALASFIASMLSSLPPVNRTAAENNSTQEDINNGQANETPDDTSTQEPSPDTTNREGSAVMNLALRSLMSTLGARIGSNTTQSASPLNNANGTIPQQRDNSTQATANDTPMDTIPDSADQDQGRPESGTPSDGGMNYESLLRLSELIGPARPRNASSIDVSNQLRELIFKKSQLAEIDSLTKTTTSGSDDTESTSSSSDTSSDSEYEDYYDGQDYESGTEDEDSESTGEDLETGFCKHFHLRDLHSSTREKCYICLNDYEEGETLRALKCQHGFHKSCVDNWLTNYVNSCPICRVKCVEEVNQPETPSTNGGGGAFNGSSFADIITTLMRRAEGNNPGATGPTGFVVIVGRR